MKKKIRRTLLFILIGILIYACFIVFPYSKKVEVSSITKENFSYDNFLGSHAGNDQIMILDDAYGSFLHRLNLIDGALQEIVFSCYMTEQSKTSDLFFTSILKAADRGVKVKMLLDGKFSGLTSNILLLLTSHENIEYYEFNQLNIFKPHYINTLMHDKYLVVDGQALILGGRNIGDRYFHPSWFTGVKTYDRDVLVYNESKDGVILDVLEYFEDIIGHQLSKKIKKTISNSKASKMNQYSSDLMHSYQEFIKNETLNYDYDELCVETNKISLIANPISGNKKEPIVGYNLMQIAKNSKEVVIQTPYTILNKNLINEFAAMIDDGVKIDLVTNSLYSSPNIPAFSYYSRHRKKLVDANIKIYEFQSEDSIHGKSLLFDNRLSSVGSFNLDERSLYIDTEVMLVIDSVEFNTILADSINQVKTESLEVGDNNKYISNEKVEERKVTFFKKATFGTAGFFVSGIYYLL